LDPVSACFAEWLARRDVPVNLLLTHLRETHARRLVSDTRLTTDSHHRNASQNVVPFRIQQAQHSSRIGIINRLAEDLVCDNNRRIRPQHHAFR